NSRNHAVWLHEYLEEFPGKQDELRYVLTSILPETSDSEFTWKDFQARVNNELVAIFGNFINRVMVLSHKYFDGKVMPATNLTDTDKFIFSELERYPRHIAASIEQYRFREALAQFMNVARLGNKYLADAEPWKLIKTDEERVKTVLNVCLQIAGNIALMAQPFLPNTAMKLIEMLRLDASGWDALGRNDLLEVGHQLGEAQLLFEKITDEQVAEQLEKLQRAQRDATALATPAVPAKEAVSFEDFAKLDIRTGIILEAEKVAKTKKLLKLKIDTGIDQRTVVSGIAEYFDPADIIGRQVSILINLEPREIRGIQSQGMILMSEDADGRLDFVAPQTPFEPGSVVR